MLPLRSPASTIFRRALFATTAALGAAMLLSSTAAQANVIFTPGNNPSGEQNIQFETQITGTTLFDGDTDQTQTPVQFDVITGPETIGTDGIGQASIICTSNCLTGITSKPQLTNLEIKTPGFGFTDFIGNLDFGEGTAAIIVTDNMLNTFNFVLGNGQNFFTLTTSDNEVMTDIKVEQYPGTAGPFGWNDFKQPRISGLCTLVSATDCRAIPVPEPSSLALLGAGIFAAGWFTTRRKSRNLTMTA